MKSTSKEGAVKNKNVASAVQLAGGASFAVGAFLAWMPAGFLVLGALALAFGVLLERG